MIQHSTSHINKPPPLLYSGAASECVVESVFLIEQDASLRAELAAALRDRSFKVVEAADGASALQLLRDINGSLEWLVTNVSLPTLSGLHVAFEYRYLYPTRPIVFIDASVSRNGERDLLDGSVTLRPPFSADELLLLMANFRRDRTFVDAGGHSRFYSAPALVKQR